MGGNQCLHYYYSHLSGVKDAIKVDIGDEASKLSGMKTIETAATESLYSAVYQAIAKKKNSTKVIVEKECTPNRIVVACGHGKVSYCIEIFFSNGIVCHPKLACNTNNWEKQTFP